MTSKITNRQDDSARFVDDGGPGAYSTHYKNLVNHVARSFLDAKARTLKEATVVGGPNSSELEKAFAQIAETYITDKAPLLTNYMLGFQLLKKSEDETKVCGIFAYKVGDELVYIPVFSLNGDIQGHELMYVVSRDQFVPSDEKWVNFLLARKPLEPGRVELRDRSDIPTHGSLRPTYMSSGLKLSSYTLLPQLDPLLALDALRTIFKQASVGTPLLEHSFWRDVAETQMRTVPMFFWKSAAAVDLSLDRLFRRSAKAVKLADRWSRDYPVFGRLLGYALDGDKLDDYLQDWEKRAKLVKTLGVKTASPKTLAQRLAERTSKKADSHTQESKVAVYGVDEIPAHRFRFMTPEQIDRIHRDGFYVTDTRDQSKLASVIVDGNDRGLTNPVGLGLYKVFMADGSFRDCFVLYLDDPTQSGERELRRLVLDKETKNTRSCRVNEIWTTSRNPEPDWFSKLPADNARLKESAKYQYERHEGTTSYLVTPSGYAWEGRFLQESENSYFEERSEIPVSLTSTSLKGFRTISTNGGPVIAPKDTVLRRYKDTDKSVALGSRQLWMAMLMEETLPVTVQKQQRAFAEYAIDGEAPREKNAALETLMCKHHLSLDASQQLLKEADAAYPRSIRRLREKIAFSGSVSQEKLKVTFPRKERGMHEVTGLDVEQDLDTSEPVEALRGTKTPDEKEMWPGLPDAETNSSGDPPAPNQADMNLAAQASQAGQREFVSSQMLLSLLREIDNDDIISEYVTIFEKACDTLGRLYMQLLWRIDAFEERFGKTQLREFREMLVALFQQMGDFICYLRQRDIRPSPVLSLGSVNINEE